MSAPDHAAHQGDVRGGRASGREAGGRLHEIRAGRLRQRAGGDLLFVGEERRLDDDLADRAALPAGPDHRFDVALHRAKVAGLQRADVDDHVDLRRAVEDGPPRLVGLDVRSRRAQRKPDDGADADAAAAQERRGGGDPGRVHAHRREVELRRFPAELLDLRPRRIRLQQRVIDHRRDAARRSAGRVHPEPARAGIDDAAQPVGTAVEQHGVAAASRRPGASRRLRGHHLLGDEVDEPLEILGCQHRVSLGSRVSGGLWSLVFGLQSRPKRSSSCRIFSSRRMYRASRIGVPIQMSTILRAAPGPSSSDDPSVDHVCAVVLARIAGDGLVRAHRRPDPAHFVGRDRRSDARAVDDDAGVGFSPRDAPRHSAGDVRIVYRVGLVGAQIEDGDAAAPQMGDERAFQAHARVVVANRHAADVRHGRQIGRQRPVRRSGRYDRDAAGRQRVLRQRRDVAAGRQLHGGADVQRPGVRLGDDVESLHAVGPLVASTFRRKSTVNLRIVEHGDVRQVAILLGVVQPVADDELVLDREARRTPPRRRPTLRDGLLSRQAVRSVFGDRARRMSCR